MLTEKIGEWITLTFIRCTDDNEDFIENYKMYKMLDIDLDRRDGKEIQRNKFKQYNQLAVKLQTLGCFFQTRHTRQ